MPTYGGLNAGFVTKFKNTKFQNLIPIQYDILGIITYCQTAGNNFHAILFNLGI